MGTRLAADEGVMCRPSQPTRIGRSVRRSNNRREQLKMRYADNIRIMAVMCVRLEPTAPYSTLQLVRLRSWAQRTSIEDVACRLAALTSACRRSSRRSDAEGTAKQGVRTTPTSRFTDEPWMKTRFRWGEMRLKAPPIVSRLSADDGPAFQTCKNGAPGRN